MTKNKKIYNSLPFKVVKKSISKGDLFRLKHNILLDEKEEHSDFLTVYESKADELLLLVKICEKFEKKDVKGIEYQKLCFLTQKGMLLYFTLYDDYKFNMTFLKVD